MRQHSNLAKDTAEKVVKDIRRATRKQYSVEEKIRIVLEGLRGEDSIAECAAARVSRRTCTIAGRRTSWRLARSAWLAIQPGAAARRGEKTTWAQRVVLEDVAVLSHR